MSKKQSNKFLHKGITFKSKLEINIYDRLKCYDKNAKYEKEVIILVPKSKNKVLFIRGDKQDKQSLRDITYTPDFTCTINDKKIYIEAKGWIFPIYPLKRKLFLKWLNENEPDSIFMEIKNVNQLDNAIEKWIL